MPGDSPLFREWSWAQNAAEVELRRAHARTLVGRRVGRIRYFTLDYARLGSGGEVSGPRIIQKGEEWRDPWWERPGFDTLDWGLELETDDGLIYSITWDPPGVREGIGISRASLIGTALTGATSAAIWDVTQLSRWKAVVSQVVDNVTMRYLPWDEHGAYWCTRVSLEVSGIEIHCLLAAGHAPDDATIYRSADDVAVIFPATQLPEWELHRTGPQD